MAAFKTNPVDLLYKFAKVDKPVLHVAKSAFFWVLLLLNITFSVSAVSSNISATPAILPQQPVQLSDTPSIILKPNNIHYWLEEPYSNASTVPDSSSVLWKKLDHKKSISVGWNTQPTWVKFNINNTLDKNIKRLLEIHWINIKQLDFYQKHADGTFSHYIGGLNPVQDQQYVNSTSYVFPIVLPANGHSDIYIKVQSNFVMFLPMIIWQEDVYHHIHTNKTNWTFLAFGMLLALMLYNASLLMFTRDKSYLFYCLYISSIIFYQLVMTGIGNYALWSNWQWMRLNSFAISMDLSMLTATLFFIHFLNIKSISKTISWLTYAICAFWAVSLTTSLLGSDALFSFSTPATLMTTAIAIYATLFLLFKGSIAARYFTIAWAVVISSTITTVLMSEGIIAYSLFGEISQLIGFVLEMLLLSVALAARINQARIQREQSQARELLLQKQINTQQEATYTAQAQLLDMQEKANLYLEQRVVERTSELGDAVTQLELVNSKLAQLSVTDALTQLYNRLYFDERLNKELHLSKISGAPLSLVLMDIDYFKRINDTYGHPVGDRCLRVISTALHNIVLRNTDLVARYGGEEFAIILTNTSEEDALHVAEKIRTHIENLAFYQNTTRIPITISLGIAGGTTNNNPNITTEYMINAADTALYLAKQQGRNCSRRAFLTGK